MKQFKKAVAFLIVFCMISSLFIAGPTALAASEADGWALSELVDAEALELVSGEYMEVILDPLTEIQAQEILETVRAKLSLIGMTAAEAPDYLETEGTTTRNDFITLLYNELLAYNVPLLLPDPSVDPLFYMVEHGIIKGDEEGELGMERECSLEEALLIAQRFITDIYDRGGLSSEGFLWKVTDGDDTLYLLGTIHVERGSVYPFSKGLKAILSETQEFIFEVDLGDTEGAQYYAQKQLYDDGTTLKDHISAELYQQVVEVMKTRGYTEEQTAQVKPWAMAFYLSSFVNSEESLGVSEAPMVMDAYIYSKAVVEGKTVSEIEGYKYQADLFDTLSSGIRSPIWKHAWMNI